MAIRPSGPSPSALERTSPSENEDLKQCRLRVAFKHADAFAGARAISLPAAMGIASHAVIEAINKGAFHCVAKKDLRSVLNDCWTKENHPLQSDGHGTSLTEYQLYGRASDS